MEKEMEKETATDTTTEILSARTRARSYQQGDIMTQKNATKKATKSTAKKKDNRGGKRPGAGNPALTGKAFDVEPGDNARFIKNAINIMNLPPIDLNDQDQVAERVNEYFTMMFNEDMKPTVTGFAMALGLNRHQLWALVNDQPLGNRFQYDLPLGCHTLIKKGYAIMGQLWEDYMQNGKINPVSGIFLGKNHFSYKDQTETIVTTPQNLLGSTESPAALEQKYLDSVVVEEE